MRRNCWVGLLLLGCWARPIPVVAVPSPGPPKPKPAPAIQIPPGCEVSLAGEWEHEEDPTFRYHFEDDRAGATVWVYRVFSTPVADAGAASSTPLAADGGDGGSHHHRFPSDGGVAPLATAVMHLRRTPDGFVGVTEQLHLLPSGMECRATFATRVTACGPSSLTLSSAGSTPVGEGCQTPSSPQPAAMLEHRLARTDAGAL